MNKENYIIPSATVFTVSPMKALMTSGDIPDYTIVNPSGIVWDEEE